MSDRSSATVPASNVSRAPSPATVGLGIGVLSLVWGSTWLVIRKGLSDWPPFTSLWCRFALASIGMALVAKRLAGSEGGGRPPLRLSLLVGTLNFTGSYCIVYYVEQFVPSALASLIFALYPLLLAPLSHRLLPDGKLTRAQFAGLLLGFAGVALLFAFDIDALGAGAMKGAVVMLCSPLVVAVGTCLLKRHGGGYSSLLLNRDALAISTVQILPLALALEGRVLAPPTLRAALCVLYLALVGTVLTFGVYFWLLRYTSAQRLAMVSYLAPLVAVLLGAAFGGEAVTASTLAGAACVIGGVAIASRH